MTPDKDYMLIAIQGPKAQKDRRDEENWSDQPILYKQPSHLNWSKHNHEYNAEAM